MTATSEKRAYDRGVRDTKKAVLLWCKDMEKIHRNMAKGNKHGARASASYLFAAEALEMLQKDIKRGSLYRDNDPRNKYTLDI
ncbi:MAG: hypothetical protein V4657_11445 [Pseudomonadota bacterium]